MNAKYSIVLVDDHTILRQGLKAILENHARFKVVGEARDGLEAIQCARDFQPDVIITDLTMPRMNGMEAIREIRSVSSHTKIIVLTVHDAEEYVFASLQAGADGYVLKDADNSELILSIESVIRGQRYLSPGISEKVVQGYLKSGQENTPVTFIWDTLTKRERETLKLIAEGYKNKEIAELLCISPKTVEKHRENLMKKLDLHSATALTTFAIEHGLIESQ